MKKFLKIFIIVLLVVASIAGTCYFFFVNIKKKNNTTSSISESLFSSEKNKFDTELKNVSTWVNSDGTDSRIELIIKTNNNLDDIVEVLASYYVESDTKINNERIAKSFNEVVESRDLLNKMLEEYKIKKASAFFNRHLGANDLYKQSSAYLVDYAVFANYLNASLQVNKASDLKFSMFEIYCNIVIDTFGNLNTSLDNVIVNNSSNINKINSMFKIKNSYIVTSVSPFDKNINLFNKVYYQCNKMEFASDFARNISVVSSPNQTTNEKLAMYYLKQIFGV